MASIRFTMTGPAWQPNATLAASEPLDDGSGWAEVPDRHLVELRPATVTVTPLEQPSNLETTR